MIAIKMDLTALEPLVITNGSAESMAHSCLDYIPGSMILGAFANLWIQDHPETNPDAAPEFQDLFLSGRVSWGNACPTCRREPCVPVPLSFRREKSHGGLPLEEKESAECVLLNALPLTDEDNLSELWKKVEKSGQLPKFKGLGSGFMAPGQMRQPRLRKVWNTRVALGKQRSALEGQLSGFSALAADNRFQSLIYCAERDVAAALEQLFAWHKRIRVGHARSAGYGLVEISQISTADQPENAIPAQVLDILLLSPYVASVAWENPLADLEANLGKALGVELKREKLFVAHQQVEGFNGHWRQWRDSRPALVAGSVLRFRADKAVNAPGFLALGGDRLEGFGRMWINPPWLAESMPPIPAPVKAGGGKTEAPCPEPTGPVWELIRRKSMERVGERQALYWLHDDHWQKFLQSAAKLDKPGASQRANLTKMSLKQFEAMLEKTPGRQWKTAVCADPFGNGQDYLSEIIKKLLDLPVFIKAFPPSALPGDPELAQEELGKGRHESYAEFKRLLIRAWGQMARARQKQGGE